MPRVMLCGLVAFGFIAVGCLAQYYDPFEIDLRKDYCGRGGAQICCEGRQDNCSFPLGVGLMETTCYCDSFCTVTHRPPLLPDCCPDYKKVCLGIPDPPMPVVKRCYYNGEYYSNGESFLDNCRKCLCSDMGNRMEIMCSQKKCLIEESLIKTVNRQRRGWTAGNVTSFWGKDLNDGYEGMLGTNYSSRKVRTMHPIISVAREADLPTNFDWRQSPGIVTPIEDQRFCNASWSFSLVSTFSDRLAKSTRGKHVGPLSYQQHRNCVRGQKRLHPCNSGYLTRSWKYVMNTGLTKMSCYPNSLDSRCAFNQSRLASRKTVQCLDGSEEKLFKASAFSRLGGAAAIMKEIQESGPVVATMRVFPEMFIYNSGIYECGNKPPKSGYLHSVKIIGWGEEYGVDNNPVKYWIVANSWGTYWGEDGFFRIRRGTNECDIEEFVISFYTNTRRLKRNIGQIENLEDDYEDEDEDEEYED